MEKKLKEQIINENIKEHKLEARYYDKIYLEIYNPFEQRRLRKTLSSILESFGKELRILDVGSGTGNVTEKIVEFEPCAKIDAVDLSEDMTNVAKNKISSKNVTFHISDIDSYIRKCKQRYHLITISSVLHHLPNYKETTKKLAQLLSENGTIYITHEPINDTLQRKGIMCKILEKIDRLLYLVYYTFLIVFRIVPRLKRDTRISDYHVGERGINPEELKFPGYKNKIVYYYEAHILQPVLNIFKCRNGFEMIIKKNHKKRQ